MKKISLSLLLSSRIRERQQVQRREIALYLMIYEVPVRKNCFDRLDYPGSELERVGVTD
jgi:hypothetical protein